MKSYIEMAERVSEVLDNMERNAGICIENGLLHLLVDDHEVATFSVEENKKHEVRFDKNIVKEEQVIEIIMILNGLFGARNYIEDRKTKISTNKEPKASMLNNKDVAKDTIIEAIQAGHKSQSNTFKALVQKEAKERKESAETPKSKLKTGDIVKVKTGDNFFVLKGTRHGDILTHVNNNFTISLKDYDDELNNIKDARYGIESIGAVREDYHYLSTDSSNYLTVLRRGEDPRIADLQKQIEELKREKGWR